MRWQCFPFLLAVQAELSAARVEFNCGEQNGKVKDHFDDAIKMASNTLNVISSADFAKPEVEVMYVVMFRDEDMEYVKSIYTKIKDIESSPTLVTFYCDEEHLEYRNDLRAWVDTDFTYANADPDNPPVLKLPAQDPSASPGEQGASYATLGRRIELGNGEYADCSDQAHVFLSDVAVNPPSEGEFARDGRRIDDINRDGLREEFTSLNSIRPLSATILHELAHVVGGLKDSQAIAPDAVITDGPGEDMYGIDTCAFERLRNILPGEDTTAKLADPYSILAKGWYLQIKKRLSGEPYDGFTLWALGVVDPESLVPPGGH